MKKTLFSALAVAAIVSAALAFAPAKSTPNIFTTNPNDNDHCTLQVNFRQDPAGPVTLTGPFTVGALNDICPDDAVIKARVDN